MHPLENNFSNNLIVKTNVLTGEEFHINYPGKTILFAGCSFTAGDGLDLKETWAYKTQEKLIKDGINVNGYRNIAVSGFSIYDILDQVFNYIFEYGDPEVIFLMLPEPNRDERYTNGSSLGNVAIISRTYKYLHHYCEKNNIKLLTMTWYKIINNIENGLNISNLIPFKIKNIFNNKNDKDIWTNQLEYNSDNFLSLILKKYNSFYDYSESEMTNFIVNNKNINQPKGLIAGDGKHPGTIFHDFWADYIYERYKNENFRN